MGNKYLARALENYYNVEGNSFIFKNGMTLNELAIEMNFRLNHKYGESFSNSVLSRVRKGERIFTDTQAVTFCEILSEVPEIDLEEIRQKILLAILQDRLWLHGIEVKPSANPEDFAFVINDSTHLTM